MLSDLDQLTQDKSIKSDETKPLMGLIRQGLYDMIL